MGEVCRGNSPISNLEVTETGRHLLTSSLDGFVVLWETSEFQVGAPAACA